MQATGGNSAISMNTAEQVPLVQDNTPTKPTNLCGMTYEQAGLYGLPTMMGGVGVTGTGLLFSMLAFGSDAYWPIFGTVAAVGGTILGVGAYWTATSNCAPASTENRV